MTRTWLLPDRSVAVQDPRQIIVTAAEGRGLSLASLSCMIGRNTTYVQQFVERGSPRKLPEDERRLLAMALDLDERKLGARDPWTPAYGPSCV